MNVLIESVLRATFLATAFSILIPLVAFGLRKASCPHRRAVWITGLALLVACPIIPWLPRVAESSWGPLPTLSIAAFPPPKMSIPPVETGVGVPQETSLSPVVATSPPPAAKSNHWPSIFATVWILGFVLVAVRSLCARARWRARIAKATNASSDLVEATRGLGHEMGLRRAPRVVVSADVHQPVCFGIHRPTLLWPASFGAYDPESHRPALAHELSHIHHGDLTITVLQDGTRAFFWFHPLVAWFHKQLDHVLEESCDQRAVAFATRPLDYARLLVDTATQTARAASSRGALAIVNGRTTSLERRVRAVIQTTPDEPLKLSWRTRPVPFLAFALAIALSIGLGFPLPSLAQDSREAPTDAKEKAKILYVAETPDWNYRYFKNELLRSKTWATQTFLRSSEPGFVHPCSADTTPLEALPSSPEPYDLVILEGIAPSDLPDGLRWSLDSFVEKGGSLLLIPGGEASALDFDASPLTWKGPLRDTKASNLALTKVARLSTRPPHAVDAGDNTSFEGVELTLSVPTHYRTSRGQVFLEADVEGERSARLPVVLVTTHRRGQCMVVLATDTWRLRTQPDLYQSLWHRWIDWLTTP